MLLTKLELAHVRSYEKRAFDFSPSITYIAGPNTSGKTNILEAIYTVATGKSFRADSDREMIHWGTDLGKIKAVIDDTVCEIYITTGSVNGVKTPLKKYTVNGVPRRMIDFVGNLQAVLFWPEHLDLVTSSPSVRRRYLDMVLAQVDREYRRNLQSYERGLRQRNRLLDAINEGRAGRNQLLFWNQLLIKAGSYLTDKRAAYIEFVNSYQELIDAYQLTYDKSVISEARLEQYKEAEVGAKATLVGPHRDDVIFLMKPKPERHTVGMNFLDLSKYGSRGEQRLAVLWIKLAEVAYIHKETGIRPILLLDDILSELDEGHQKLVFEVVEKQQTIITSADEESIELLKKTINPKVTKIEIIRLGLA